MKATKYTVTITVEVLSLFVVPSLVTEAVQNIEQEAISGSLFMDDGDSVTWTTQANEVEF